MAGLTIKQAETFGTMVARLEAPASHASAWMLGATGVQVLADAAKAMLTFAYGGRKMAVRVEADGETFSLLDFRFSADGETLEKGSLSAVMTRWGRGLLPALRNAALLAFGREKGWDPSRRTVLVSRRAASNHGEAPDELVLCA